MSGPTSGTGPRGPSGAGSDADELTTGPSAIEAPVLRIVNDDATPEEIAAIVAVFSSLGTPAHLAAAAPKPAPAWSHNRRKMRIDFRHGRGGWRASSLPQ